MIVSKESTKRKVWYLFSCDCISREYKRNRQGRYSCVEHGGVVFAREARCKCGGKIEVRKRGVVPTLCVKCYKAKRRDRKVNFIEHRPIHKVIELVKHALMTRGFTKYEAMMYIKKLRGSS